MFFEAINLGFSADDPIVVHNGTIGAVFIGWKHTVSLLKVIDSAQIPAHEHIV
jgi:hypothetical protein